MKVSIIARTVEVGSTNTGTSVDLDFKKIAGKTAGICYMPEDYLDNAIQNEEKALARADMTAKSGHHSVYDHASLTISISGIPKILAMLLNSTNYYVTSEKSARYTVMRPETNTELALYEKWIGKFKEIISTTYPKIDAKTVNKLAQENARYMTSVFTPTTMAYTVSQRQLCYIIGWLFDLNVALANHSNLFNDKLMVSVRELYSELWGLFATPVKDNKGREFDFIPCQYGHKKVLPENHIGNTYSVSYKGTFAQLAQAQRHRTLSYTMWFKGDTADELGFYVPEIIKGTEYEAEWLADIKSVAYCFPQGTLVMITEEGLAKHFFLKCKERLCGRAQLEIALQTAETLRKFIANEFNLSKLNQDTLRAIAPNDTPVAKCGMTGFTCTEVCMWGAKDWHNRKI